MISAERINTQLLPLCEKAITSVDPGVGVGCRSTVNVERVNSQHRGLTINVERVYSQCREGQQCNVERVNSQQSMQRGSTVNVREGQLFL